QSPILDPIPKGMSDLAESGVSRGPRGRRCTTEGTSLGDRRFVRLRSLALEGLRESQHPFMAFQSVALGSGCGRDAVPIAEEPGAEEPLPAQRHAANSRPA